MQPLIAFWLHIHTITDVTTAAERALQIIHDLGGTIRTTEAIRAGIHYRTLYALRDAGQLEQQTRGTYRIADGDLPTDPDLALISKRIPNAVVCLISALAIHELTTQIPHAVHVAIPRTARYPRLPEVVMEVHRYATASYQAGIQVIDHDGITVQVYDVDKTIADCFKFRNQIGLDITLEALKARSRQPGWSPQRILDYARINRVAKTITPYLEATL